MGITKSFADTCIERAEKATKTVAWYPHQKEVRGPFHRWFILQEGDHQSDKFPGNKGLLASVEDDIQYCAMAMNAMPELARKLKLSIAMNRSLIERVEWGDPEEKATVVEHVDQIEAMPGEK